ncbi:hypothetical protein PQX77_019270 [Marasmius sp. AFHP31]|nr:hypothetical protein PQX77_019270 [Marasmius sp. AFHP31]
MIFINTSTSSRTLVFSFSSPVSEYKSLSIFILALDILNGDSGYDPPNTPLKAALLIHFVAGAVIDEPLDLLLRPVAPEISQKAGLTIPEC